MDHQAGSASGTATETVTGGVVTWNQSRSGNSSGYLETGDAYGNTLTWHTVTQSGNTTRVDDGYSAGSNSVHDRVDTTFDWSNSSAQDGSAEFSWSSGGLHQWSNTNDLAWNIAWSETTTSGSSSGSGSGMSSPWHNRYHGDAYHGK